MLSFESRVSAVAMVTTSFKIDQKLLFCMKMPYQTTSAHFSYASNESLFNLPHTHSKGLGIFAVVTKNVYLTLLQPPKNAHFSAIFYSYKLYAHFLVDPHVWQYNLITHSYFRIGGISRCYGNYPSKTD